MRNMRRAAHLQLGRGRKFCSPPNFFINSTDFMRLLYYNTLIKDRSELLKRTDIRKRTAVLFRRISVAFNDCISCCAISKSCCGGEI